MASSPYQATDPGTDAQYHGDHISIDSDVRVILPVNTSNTIITAAPEERFRLGRWDVVALVVNRVIG
jgi:hypothetical protein